MFDLHNKIAIVTSSNKKAAEYILNYTGLYKYIDLVIASDDCIHTKPDPEPYLKAIKYFNTNIEKNSKKIVNIYGNIIFLIFLNNGFTNLSFIFLSLSLFS